MRELTITRHNDLIDPLVHVWGWEIPAYLFLGGLVAGAMVIVGTLILLGRHRGARCVCSALPALGLALLSLGMLALFLDLEHKRYVWRLYTTFQPASPMSWGAWILVAVYPTLAAAWLVRPPSLLQGIWPAFEALAGRVQAPRVVGAIAAANIVLGVALGVYTGVLLSALGARPFWNSALLGVLFLVSGVSSAAALSHLLSRDDAEAALVARADQVLLLAELAVLALFLVGLATAAQAHADAARLVLGGPYTAALWVYVVGLGILFPLAVQGLALRGRIGDTAIGPLAVLGGGLALRVVIVAVGQASRWP